MSKTITALQAGLLLTLIIFALCGAGNSKCLLPWDKRESERSDHSLNTDKDHNGVRDDVDAYIDGVQVPPGTQKGSGNWQLPSRRRSSTQAATLR